jgi:hypothetical protein
MLSPEQKAILGEYVDAMNKYGRDSKEATKLYQDSMYNKEVIELMDVSYILHLVLSAKE